MSLSPAVPFLLAGVSFLSWILWSGNRKKYPWEATTNLRIIAFSGKRFCGKDTAAHLAQKQMEDDGKTVLVTSIATPLKERYCRLNGLDFQRFMTDRAYKEEHRTRLTNFLEETESRRGIGYFSDLLMSRLHQIEELNRKGLAQVDCVIIPDIRRIAEAEYLKNHFQSWLVRLETSPYSREQRGWVRSRQDDHPTETEMDKFASFDGQIENNGSTPKDLQTLDDALSDLWKDLS